MKKQMLFAAIAVVLVISLFFFGNTVAKKDPTIMPPARVAKTFNINDFITESKKKLTVSQAEYLSKLENSVTRGDVSSQQIKVYNALANFWKDSVKAFEPYAYYISEASKLDNSEKNLTFAAQLFLEGVRNEPDEAKLNWESEQAIALFEKALQQNPDDADLKIGLGSCYIFGKGKFGGPAETMQGIQKVLEVVRKDSANMKAQLVLGVGGFFSGQYDKAIERLNKVVTAQPNNVEAVATLADIYAAKGNKQEAIKWYQKSKQLITDPHYAEEVDKRIKELK